MAPIIIYLVALTAVATGPALQGRGPGGVPGSGSYEWPVRGPVIQEFEPPSDPYGPGHRGIDIGAAFGTEFVAAEEGIVAFAGWVGGSLFISIDHPDGIRTTYSWLSEIGVKKGDPVTRGQPIGRTGHGHLEIPEPHLHFGARIGTTYIDPIVLLEPGAVVEFIHLAPLTDLGPATRSGADADRFGAWSAWWARRVLDQDRTRDGLARRST